MTDSGPFEFPQRVEDRRTSQRKQTCLPVKITYNGGAYSFDCVILDISDSGACIEIPDGETLPKHVDLIDMKGGVAYASEVRWRARSQLGVLFTCVYPLNGQLPEEARFLERVWTGSSRRSNSGAMAVTLPHVRTKHSPETAFPPIRHATAESEVNPEMIGAGIAAYTAWKSGEFAWLHSEHDMVRAVFLAMLRAKYNGG
jgi:hypothetical protein